jgi:hypothetical protein
MQQPLQSITGSCMEGKTKKHLRIARCSDCRSDSNGPLNADDFDLILRIRTKIAALLNAT